MKQTERSPTLHDSMNGTGEYYAKWNKPSSERQIPYDLTYKWNLMNKTNKWGKQNQRHWNKEQTDSDQMGVGWEIMGKEGEGASQGTWIEDSYAWTMRGDYCGSEGVMGQGRATAGVGRSDNCNWTMAKKNFKKCPSQAWPVTALHFPQLQVQPDSHPHSLALCWLVTAALAEVGHQLCAHVQPVFPRHLRSFMSLPSGVCGFPALEGDGRPRLLSLTGLSSDIVPSTGVVSGACPWTFSFCL